MILFRGNRGLHAYNKKHTQGTFFHISISMTPFPVLPKRFLIKQEHFSGPEMCPLFPQKSSFLFLRCVLAILSPIPNLSPIPISDSNSFSYSYLLFFSDSDSHMYFVNPLTAQVMDTPRVVPVMTRSNRWGETPFFSQRSAKCGKLKRCFNHFTLCQSNQVGLDWLSEIRICRHRFAGSRSCGAAQKKRTSTNGDDIDNISDAAWMTARGSTTALT